MWTQYISPTTVEEALLALAKHGAAARLIAGGTDMLIELERGQRPGVTVMIDISRIPGLNQIEADGETIRLGPMVTHNQVVASVLIQDEARPLALACWEVGAPQIRNRATIAGNLITASPANDSIPPLLVLDASVHLTSAARGDRTVRLADFYTGLRRTIMQPDEMLTAIHIPRRPATARGTFLKLGLREAQAISVINVAALLHFDGDQVTHAALALGSVAPTVIRMPEVEAALVGKPLDETTIRDAARLAAAITRPISDVRGTAAYRTEMVKVLVARALRSLRDGQPPLTWEQPAAMLWGKHQGHSTPLPASVTHEASQPIETTINGEPLSISSGQHKTLLRFLREDVGLTGTKEGCAEGECGACTVFLDDSAVMACMVPAPRAHGAAIVTVEGLAQGEDLHAVQQSFIDAGAVQCGYCTPGFIMAGAKLLEEHDHPSRAQVQQSISGNLCRCTGYYKIMDAIMVANDLKSDKEN